MSLLGATGGLALNRLRAVADRGGGDAVLVAALLESAAHAAEVHSVAGALPAAERDLWESVGATFDPGGWAGNDERLIDAFGDLVARSVVGDAAMADLLDVDRSRVSQRLTERSLYSFLAGDQRCFPRWQLVEQKPVRGLKAVLTVLDPALHPLTVDHWFSAPNVDLEVAGEPVSPVRWLTTGGDPQAPAQLAADL